MAKTQIKFLSGFEENLPELIVNGQLYFVVADDGKGKILFDRDNKRYIMSQTDYQGGINLTKKYYQVGEKNIPSNNLVGLDKNGLVVPAASTSFLVNSPLFISAFDLKAKDIGEEVGFYSNHYNILLKEGNYELNKFAYKPLYLKGKISNGLFQATSNPYTCSLPDKEDEYCYLYIGEVNNYRSLQNNLSYINFNTEHPIYQFRDGEIQLYSPVIHAETADRLLHTLTIGDYSFDGSKDVKVPVFDGDTTYN